MAKRLLNKNEITFDEIVNTLGALIIGGKDVASVVDVAKQLNTTPSVIMTVWQDEDPDGNVIDGDRGEMWLVDENDVQTPPPVTPKVPTPAERMSARKAAPKPAVTPVLDKDGEPIIAPETGGRQLDASEGERVLSEGDVRELVKGTNSPSESEKTVTEINGSWINDGGESHMTEYKEGEPIHPGHTRLPEVEFMDAPPEGVNPNFWELYKGAATLNARAHWGRKVAEEIKAHKEAVKAAEEAAPAPVVYELPIDPVTGEPMAF